MEAANWQDCPEAKVDKFPYRGKMRDVIRATVRYLSKYDDDGNGQPEYGLRFFTIQPGGQVPFHNHF